MATYPCQEFDQIHQKEEAKVEHSSEEQVGSWLMLRIAVWQKVGRWGGISKEMLDSSRFRGTAPADLSVRVTN